jgi:chromosome segregation ATPase
MIVESEALQTRIAELEATLKQRDAAQQTQTAVIADLEAVVAERQRIIDELSASNRRLQDACEERLALIVKQQRTIAELQRDLQASSAFPGIVKLQEENQAKLDDQLAANARLQTVADERAALIESQAQSLAMMAEECNQRDEEIARLHATALERLAVIEALNAALERLPR